jgi:hypothetical protein
VSGRSVKEYGGTITKRGYIACTLPSWLQTLSEKVNGTLGKGFFKHAPEHVLVNAYQPGVELVCTRTRLKPCIVRDTNHAFASSSSYFSCTSMSVTSNGSVAGSCSSGTHVQNKSVCNQYPICAAFFRLLRPLSSVIVTQE